jgi:hypothetical protein
MQKFYTRISIYIDVLVLLYEPGRIYPYTTPQPEALTSSNLKRLLF